MRDALLVALGGTLGALARYGVGVAFPHTPGKHFPVATLLVNVVGCLLIGMIGQVLQRFAADASVKPNASELLLIATLRQAIIVGFLGGLTTFSAFGWDSTRLFLDDRPLLALSNIAANLLAGLFAVWLGITLVKMWS
ncbi:MAG: fluoride efflux transporter FluC [Pirellulaceae bacterium]